MSLKKIISVFLMVGIAAFIVFFIWSQQVSHADKEMIAKVRVAGTVTIEETDHSYILKPAGYKSGSGLLFVPGGKVAPEAYIYKLSGLVESLGMTVVITKPYFNLALLDFRPFSALTYDVGGIEDWYVGGHSLGGVRACDYAKDPHNDVKGIVLFAAYCESEVSVPALSLRGEHDGLVSEDDMRTHSSSLLAGDDYYEIEGANHASFGDYGVQEGDGAVDISPETMRDDIVGYFASWPALEN